MLSLKKSKIKILLLEGIDRTAESYFQNNGYVNIEVLPCALERDELIEKLQSVFLLGIRSRTKITAEVLNRVPKLFAIGCYCIGTNQVDLKEAAERGIPVFNAPHANTRSVAELVIGLTIMLMRDIFPKSLAAHQGQWLKTSEGSHEVRGKVIGIIGYGHIGSQVSVLAEAMGMRVVYYDIVDRLPLGNATRFERLEDVLANSDIVTLHVPDTILTAQMLDTQRLKLMKQGACLINASRGSVIDIKALHFALKTGKLKGAALDVFPDEPENNSLAFDTVLRGNSQVILTPHIGGSTLEAQCHIGLDVTRKLISYSDIGSTEGAVNFPSLYLPRQRGTHRILNIHQNVPGMLQKINRAVADERINVQSQYLLTNEQIGYVVLDIERKVSRKLQSAFQEIGGSIRTRILY